MPMSLFRRKKKRKTDSKEVGLEFGLMIFKFFLKTEYLHYGYFINGLEADVTNLKKAHENYTEMLISQIPAGTKTILDVGCGSGKTAQVLCSKGYQVDCVSPSQILTTYARKITPGQVQFFHVNLKKSSQTKNTTSFSLAKASSIFPWTNQFQMPEIF